MKLFSWGKDYGEYWFRIFGYGLDIVNHRKKQASFSERYGYRQTVHIGRWCFSILVPTE